MIEILSTLPLNTVQDLGRSAQRHLGVSTGGAMDTPALALGNAMVGNAAGAAGIELQTFPFSLRFEADRRFAITGADARASLDGRPLMAWWTRPARRGQVLRIEHPSHGARVYLCIEGGIDVPEVLGSRSTDVRSAFGGHEGRFLRRGDRLPLGDPQDAAGASNDGRAMPEAGSGRDPGEAGRGFGILPPAAALAQADAQPGLVRVRALPAGEHAHFPEAAQADFWRSDWRIGHQSNRAGYRFSGPPLLLDAPMELRSYGVVPGLVQVPPGGQPIVQLSDANTAGGYPKMATVIEADLWRLGQARPGDRVRFVEVNWPEALGARQALKAYLARVRSEILHARQRAAEAVTRSA